MARYAVSDLHGQLDLFNQIVAFIQPGDIVYCLGDAGDRGPRPWETLKAAITHPQFVYIRGNHDDLLWDAWHGNTLNLFYNGGRGTFEGLKAETSDERTKLIHMIRSAPAHMEIVNEQGQNVSLSHGGFDPWEDNDTFRNYTWNRDHLGNEWDIEGVTHNIDIMVHGHTPFLYIYADGYDVEGDFQSEDDTDLHAVWYCGHHKVCIDMGAFYTNQTTLLNLDTWEEHHFTVTQ